LNRREISSDCGIVFRTLGSIFDYIGANIESKQFQVTLSFMEIYKETIVDLLSVDGKKQKESLMIREDPETGIFVSGLTQQAVRSLGEAIDLIRTGVKERMTSTTLMNKTSSRSHAIIQILVE